MVKYSHYKNNKSFLIFMMYISQLVYLYNFLHGVGWHTLDFYIQITFRNALQNTIHNTRHLSFMLLACIKTYFGKIFKYLRRQLDTS